MSLWLCVIYTLQGSSLPSIRSLILMAGNFSSEVIVTVSWRNCVSICEAECGVGKRLWVLPLYLWLASTPRWTDEGRLTGFLHWHQVTESSPLKITLCSSLDLSQHYRHTLSLRLWHHAHAVKFVHLEVVAKTKIPVMLIVLSIAIFCCWCVILVRLMMTSQHASSGTIIRFSCLKMLHDETDHIPSLKNHSKLLYEINQCIIELIFHKLPLEESVLDWIHLIIVVV